MSVNPMARKDDDKERGYHVDCQPDQDGPVSNPREKLLIILAFIFLVLVLSLLAAIVISIAIGTLFPKSDICMTKSCVKRAAYILGNLNENVNPCDDFYEFSCGGWKDKSITKLPDMGVIDEMQLKVLIHMQRIIKNLSDLSTKGENPLTLDETEVKVLTAIGSCNSIRNTSTLLNSKDEYKSLFEDFGGFPMVDNKDVKNIEENIANLFRFFGVSPVIGISVSPYSVNTKENILTIYPPDISSFKNFEDDFKAVEKFFADENISKDDVNAVRTLYSSMKAILENSANKEVYKEVVISSDNTTGLAAELGTKFKIGTFISKLLHGIKDLPERNTEAASTVPGTVSGTETKNGDERKTLKETTASRETTATMGDTTLTEVTPPTTLMNNNDKEVSRRRRSETDNPDEQAGAKQTDSKPDTETNPKIKILISYPSIIKAILELIGDTDKKIVNNFLSIQFVHNHEDMNLPFFSERVIKDVENKINLNCLLDVSQYLNFAFDSIYVKNTELALKKAEDLITHIQNALKGFIKDYQWLSDEDKTKVTEKLENMNYYVGAPKWIENVTALNEYYKDLTLGESPIKNYMNMIKFNVEKLLKKLLQENDRNSWPDLPGLSTTTVNAFYSADLNIFIMPAAILSAPIFDENLPFYLNFGSLGTIIGHEITHGFDTNGRVRNSFGNIPTHEIWSTNAVLEYQKIANCFERQYSAYKIGNQMIEGIKTLAENIADNGAIREALWGYRTWLKEHHKDKKEESLPTFGNFTHEQMFFISYAQNWCHSASRAALREQLKNDVHTPNEFRVIGSLANSKEFSEAFNCKKTTIMNPEERCNLW